MHWKREKNQCPNKGNKQMQTHDTHEAFAIGGMVYAAVLFFMVLDQRPGMSWEFTEDHFSLRCFVLSWKVSETALSIVFRLIPESHGTKRVSSLGKKHSNEEQSKSAILSCVSCKQMKLRTSLYGKDEMMRCQCMW